MTEPLSPQDIEDVRARGLTPEEVLRQKGLLEVPPPAPVLARPCRLGDGVLSVRPRDAADCARVFNLAREEGQLAKFVPASGAASRMFHSIVAQRAAALPLAQVAEKAASSRDAAELLKFVRNLRHFPFYPALKAHLGRKGLDPAALLARDEYLPCVDAVLGADALNLPAYPKGALPFHRYKDRIRTAFEEHLIESIDILRDKDGLCRLHFTVSPEHDGLLRALAGETLPRLEGERRSKFQVSFSHQSPATGTVALDAEGRLARGRDGRLLFRPGGHGALLSNLAAMEADIVLVKNIDNVPHESHPGENAYWEALQVGLLLELQREVFLRLSWLATRPNDLRILEEAELFCAQKLNIVRPAPSAAGDAQADMQRRHQRLMAKLNRPIRVCAVVPNAGEPGGGPFWVRGKDGVLEPQIVESAQVSQDPEQKKIFISSTHFNPVNMACGLKDWRGQRFDLARFCDPSAVFLAEKSDGGRPLRVLERPGLWNGGMADWITVFMEAPLSTFHPVKTVNDLLRADHQPAVAQYAMQENP